METLQRLKTGKVVMTRGISDRVADDIEFSKFVMESLMKHEKCDWGDICDDDKKLNDKAFKEDDDRILSAYTYNDTEKIWIITEWDRSVTTILFPSEY